MGIGACSACGGKVSDRAETCPHCGEPKPREVLSSTLRGTLRLAALILVGWLVYQSGFFSDGAGPTAASTAETVAAPPQSKEKAASDASKGSCAAADLDCLANERFADASVACRRPIQGLAKYNYEWTDGWFTPRFSQYEVKDKVQKIVAYYGDKIKFQNGFGAWSIYTYECDFDLGSGKVIDVEANPGQLN